MTLSAAAPPISPLRRYWRDRALWTTIADVFAILTVLSLPWSTTLPAIFVLLWLGAVAWVMDWRAYGELLKQPICYLPFALVGLALAGTLWSDAAWSVRLYAVIPTLKLLVLPGLFYHFERSSRGMWVLAAFLASCALLMVMSWVVAYDPSLSLKGAQSDARGVFVKNYIDQSQEFALCAIALIYPSLHFARRGKFGQSLLAGLLAAGFIGTMAFIVASRSAMVAMPIMLAAVALVHMRLRTTLVIIGVMVAFAGVIWVTTADVRWSPKRLLRDYQLYKAQESVTSIGLRLEFWKKSLRFFSEAPVIGHGTGSLRPLFERAATDYVDPAQRGVISNPHNQTLNIAVQWGAVGVILLYAMWLVHLLLFRGQGFVAWIGLLVVVQNIFTSLFNSHLFDFHEGWMYVLGVGIAGGMTLAVRQRELTATLTVSR
ncbi:O-antigen ligase family protein [Bradyrhizobium roseum]|uniref:O-antigen ligase family protein n=1 Tax=Bradyrhizobium roseum TaxID=3056648 RepID=UPI0026205453|nr:O-antigen ligase family protein [Bradyrhizobium roseus]WKA26930.1 O-antigen ligase family protein [Bradyrhizobium roseus]